jgi:hypothetical protein
VQGSPLENLVWQRIASIDWMRRLVMVLMIIEPSTTLPWRLTATTQIMTPRCTWGLTRKS